MNFFDRHKDRAQDKNVTVKDLAQEKAKFDSTYDTEIKQIESEMRRIWERFEIEERVFENEEEAFKLRSPFKLGYASIIKDIDAQIGASVSSKMAVEEQVKKEVAAKKLKVEDEQRKHSKPKELKHYFSLKKTGYLSINDFLVKEGRNRFRDRPNMFKYTETLEKQYHDKLGLLPYGIALAERIAD